MTRGKTSAHVGRSLFELAKEAGSLEQTAQELNKITEIISGLPDAEKHFIGQDAEKRDLRNLVDVLAGAASVFHKLHDQHQGIQEAFVESAVPLEKDVKAALEEKVKNLAKGKVRTEYRVNKNLVAGFKLRLGEKVIDCSTASHLKRMREGMMASN